MEKHTIHFVNQLERIMKSKLLFPQIFRPFGILLAAVGFVLGYLVLYQKFIIPGFGWTSHSTDSILRSDMNFTDELAITLCIVGLIFIAFSRLKAEDELSSRLRLGALHWAVWANTILILLFMVANNLFILPHSTGQLFGPWSIFSDADWIIYTLFTPLVLFIIKFWHSISKMATMGSMVKKPRELPTKPFRQIGILGSLICVLILTLSLLENQIPWIGHLISENLMRSVWYFFPLFILFWIFSKEKLTDEFSEQVRLENWQLAFYIHYGLILILTYSTYGLNYLAILFIFVPYLLPVIYALIRFINRLKRQNFLRNEEYAENTTSH